MADWIVPCNLNYYDVYGAFEKLDTLDWKQTCLKIAVGDYVYIYVGAPVSAIVFKCAVTKVQLKTVEIDDTAFAIVGEKYETAPLHMELKLLKRYPDGLLSARKLSEHGLRGRIMCQRRMEDSVSEFIMSATIKL